MADSLQKQIELVDQYMCQMVESAQRFLAKHIDGTTPGAGSTAPAMGEYGSTNELMQRVHVHCASLSALLERMHNEI